MKSLLLKWLPLYAVILVLVLAATLPAQTSAAQGRG